MSPYPVFTLGQSKMTDNVILLRYFVDFIVVVNLFICLFVAVAHFIPSPTAYKTDIIF